MPIITIKGTPISIPSSGSNPNWSPAIIEAFQALADAVNVFTGTFDIAPQAKNIDIYNAATNIDIDNLSFPPTDVRAVTVFYTVYRKTEESVPSAGDAMEVAESGTLECVYNNSRPSNQKWEIGRMGESDAQIDFNMTDIGQVQFSTTALTGINHTGIVSYRALSILNSN
jgi:hypothetical protein